jgi:hypothetical protein
MEIENIKHRVDLYKLLPKNPVTAELGVAEAYFSEHICREWNPSHHYLVDNWGTLPTTGDGAFDQHWHDANYHKSINRMEPFKDKITILRGITWRMDQHVNDETLDLVYLDACHTYEAVKQDLEAWYPKVKPGGVIAGHDFINPAYGVLQAVNEFSIRYTAKVHVIHENHDSDAGFWFYKTK